MAAYTAVAILLCVCLVKFIETKTITRQKLIVGGHLANIEDYPHSVFLYIRCNNIRMECGASILNQEILLTAAHCVSICNADFNVTAYTGSEIKYEGDPIQVSSIKVHEEYIKKYGKTYGIKYDIALLKLENKLTFTKKVRSLRLGKVTPKDKTGEVAGWGLIDHELSIHGNRLKHVKQKIVDHKTCKTMVDFGTEGTICAERIDYNHPSRGDSGSALVVGRVGHFTHIGILSGGSDSIIHYTDVYYFRDWIKENTDLLLYGSEDDRQLL